MSAQNAHAHEDRLLDFAYGELPPSEAQSLEQHVQGCARCSKALSDIRGVRSTMAHLSVEPAPDAGLESLLAYAQQSARRAAAGPEPKPSRWRRWLLPAVGLATVSTFGILTLEVNKSVKLEPQLSAKALREEPLKAKKDVYGDSAQAQAVPAPAPSAPVAAAMPKDEEPVAGAPLGSRMDEMKAAPKSRGGGNRPSDWMNAGSGGAMLERRSAGSLGAKKKMPSFPQEEAEGVATGAASSNELKAGPSALAKEAPAPVESLDRDSAGNDKAMKQEVSGALRLGGASASGRAASEDDALFADRAASPPPPPASAPPAQVAAPKAPAATSAPRREQPAPGKGAVAAAEPPMEAALQEVAKPQAVEKSARAVATTSRDLARQAQDAADQGDRARESQFLRAALAAGARGSERLSLLSRLCESQYAQGRSTEAAEVCEQIISEAPGSAAAQVAQRRLRQLAPAPATPAQ
ncbi:zf-HC2 domain-containing protein [Corallococcus sp. CA053C]|uniref:anti-sigma factor family protein n=1 Tax=Corallococcus sp. CA053C TaxID=2316732 RepID=UPI000EA176FE|nr:zf-HC2 domain-containing protein [Corallococcus sp. CA053C]RKG97440.1 zf-HC2 domain-containing protein [Corallococcus sp. CA053C]